MLKLKSKRRINALHFWFSDLVCIHKKFPEPSQGLQEFSLKRYINVIEGSRSPPDRCCSQTLPEARYRIRNLKRALLAPGNSARPPAIRCTAAFSRSIHCAWLCEQ
jgi:hypothetical protein